MRKVERWLVERVLPVWAREELLGKIRALETENQRLRQVIERKEEYISGLKWAIRHTRRNAVGEEKR